jgi:hypothetical protein
MITSLQHVSKQLQFGGPFTRTFRPKLRFHNYEVIADPVGPTVVFLHKISRRQVQIEQIYQQ